jgi:serpin B
MLLLAVPCTAAARAPRLTPAQSSGAFGLDLLRRLPPGNLVFSPDSIETALAMAGEGARGQTAAQIARVTHLPSPAAFVGLGALQADLALESAATAKGDPQAPRLAIANGLFVQEGFALQPQFLAGLQSGFGAVPQTENFQTRNAEAVQAVNEWGSAHTEGLIPQVVSSLRPETRLVLANAVYLDAKWADPFEARATSPASFHAPGGASQVPFMHETASLPYAAGRGYRAVELPYRSSTLSLLLVMPQGRSLARMQRGLTIAGLDRIARRLRTRAVTLSLPKFHVHFQEEHLAEPLKALGMTLPFSEAGADFSGMSSCRCLHIGEVAHVADIRVAEEGTVAAAVTVVVAEALSARTHVRPPVRFDADRPFLFFLRDDRTGAVLFAGRLTDAAAAQS